MSDLERTVPTQFSAHGELGPYLSECAPYVVIGRGQERPELEGTNR